MTDTQKKSQPPAKGDFNALTNDEKEAARKIRDRYKKWMRDDHFNSHRFQQAMTFLSFWGMDNDPDIRDLVQEYRKWRSKR